MVGRPKKRDIVRVSLPKKHVEGSEQHGHPWRPCVVVSAPKGSRHGLVAVVPITSKSRGAPTDYEVFVTTESVVTRPGEPGLEKSGVALCDHLRFIDVKRLQSPGGSSTDRFGAVSRETMGRIELAIANALCLPTEYS